MEQQPDIFAQLNTEIDWETQFTETAAPLFEALQNGETGRELIDQTANLLAMAEHQESFMRLQLLVQLGDICCSNPGAAEAFQQANFYEEMTKAHQACSDDDHDHDNKKTKKRRRKKRKQTTEP